MSGWFDWLFGCEEPIDSNATIVATLRQLRRGQAEQTRLLRALLEVEQQRSKAAADLNRITRCSGTYPNR